MSLRPSPAALGRHRPASDIDLTLLGPDLSSTTLARIDAELDDLLLPWVIALSCHACLRHPALLDHIERDGLVLYERTTLLTVGARSVPSGQDDPTITPFAIPPLVLVHGLLDTPAVFNGLKRELGGGRQPLLSRWRPREWCLSPGSSTAALPGGRADQATGLAKGYPG